MLKNLIILISFIVFIIVYVTYGWMLAVGLLLLLLIMGLI